MKRIIVVLVVILVLIQSLALTINADESTKQKAYWAEPTTEMEPMFLSRPSVGVEWMEYGLQFVANESFSQFILVLNGQGTMKINLYKWDHNVNFSLESEPLWSLDWEQTTDKEYIFDCGTFEKGEYLIYLQEPEAESSHLGIYTIPDPNIPGTAETWNDLETTNIVCGGLIYDKAPEGALFGEVSLPKAFPTQEPAEPSPEPTEKAEETQKPTDTKDEEEKDKSNVTLYVIIGLASVIIVGAVIFIILKRRK